jgi:hypothetical protein
MELLSLPSANEFNLKLWDECVKTSGTLITPAHTRITIPGRIPRYVSAKSLFIEVSLAFVPSLHC